ncbi:pectinesterase [Musa troglodytarum]|uniref:pectinesterase n=1 Tax=Musa troglodytarum TaxID=320322 RepID=A0A9E7EMB9_9LILI|nr:pectinesterase [Musa troglodytarum]
MTVLSTSLHVPVATAAASIAKTIVVNPSGTGDFRSVQEAVNSVPDYNNQWIKIHLASGVYRFDRHCCSCAKHAGEGGDRRYKSYILLEGEGAQKTSIEWGDYASDSRGHDTASCGTFTSYASNIVVAGITFKVKFAAALPSLCASRTRFTRRPACMREVEAYMIRSLVQNTYDGYSHTKQAVAALIAGDKSSLYSCGFVGYQDTLADLFGRHYFKGCYIQGVTDFIFGLGQSIYEVSTRTCRDSIRVHGSP